MTRFIAEISSNHNGNKERCLELIRAASASGCWGVKFQLFRIEQLFAPEILQSSETHRLRRRWELPLHFLPDLAACARQEGLALGCTPFDLEAVDILLPHVDFLKIASYELPWLDLIRRCGETGLPLMFSCGMAEEDEVFQAVETARAAGVSDLTVFHCVSNYPVAPSNCNLAAIGTLQKLFPNTSIGWSDHSVDPAVVSRAIQHWQCDAVEFHFDLEGHGDEFNAGHCWLPQQITPLVSGQEYDAAAHCDGRPEIQPTSSEEDERTWRADPADGLRPTLSVRRKWSLEKKIDPTDPLVVFRAGGPGLGHLARLLAVAETLRSEFQIIPVFVCSDSPGSQKLLARNGFRWLPDSTYIFDLNPAAVILDQKEPCQQIVQDCKSRNIQTVLIDRPDCHADLVVIPCFGWQNDNKNERHFGGSDYQLLRGDILNLRPAHTPEPGNRIVVSFGGEDPNLLTEKTATALGKLAGNIPVQFVIGPDFHKHRKTWPPNSILRPEFQLIETSDPLETILPGAGLLITAMGVTIAEAHVLGVPAAVLSNYKSDEDSVRRLVEADVVADLGYHADLADDTLAATLEKLWNDTNYRKNIATRGLQKTDGLGSQRAARLIAALLQLDPAEEDNTC